MVGHRFIEDLLDKAEPGQFDITVLCEEPRVAYDRVHLSSYFSHHTAEELSLVREGFYEKHNVNVLIGERAITLNRKEKVIHSSSGRTVVYDKLIIATGSYPWVPPILGSDGQDCFVYRTIEDLHAIEACARAVTRCGGRRWPARSGSRWRAEKPRRGTHVVEFAPGLMAEQLDVMGGSQLRQKIESMGVQVHTAKNTKEIVQGGSTARKTMEFATAARLKSISSSSHRYRPQDKLARHAIWTSHHAAASLLTISVRPAIRTCTPSANVRRGISAHLACRAGLQNGAGHRRSPPWRENSSPARI